MIIKFKSKPYTIKITDLPSNTIGGLKEKIKKEIPQCSQLPNEKIMLFSDKTKLSSDDNLSLDDVTPIINDNSIIYVVLFPSDAQQNDNTQKKQAEKTYKQPQSPGSFGTNMPNDSNPMFNNTFVQNMFNNPEMLNSMISTWYPNASPEQIAMIKNMTEAISKDPNMLNNLMAGVPNMGGMPNMPFSPQAYNSPMNPMFSSPNMGNQYYPQGNPYGYYPPNMMQMPQFNPQAFQNNQSKLPDDFHGPCSHGFYRPNIVNGNPERPNASEVYASQLATLKEMGFSDEQSNKEALMKTNGNVEFAIEILTKKHENYQN